MTSIALSVPPEILQDCSLERWNVLSLTQREYVAARLADALSASGYAFAEWRIEWHGPEQEQPVLLFTDSRNRLEFALIPGGTLQPRYDDVQLQRYRSIFVVVERYKEPLVSNEPRWGTWENDWQPQDEWEWGTSALPEPPTPPATRQFTLRDDPTLDHPTVFASTAPCDLRRKPPVSIDPFLMATTPILAGASAAEQYRDKYDEDDTPIRVGWAQVPAMLEQFSGDIPTTHEWEWASQGGVSGIFYWGDQVPRFVVNPIRYYAFDDDDEDLRSCLREEAKKNKEIANEWTDEERALLTDAVRFEQIMAVRFSANKTHRFPFANRFGLLGLLGAGEWCAPSDVPNDPEPLIARGGAAGCFPWQSCHEWMLLLRAAEVRSNINTSCGNRKAVRPIIRLRTAGTP